MHTHFVLSAELARLRQDRLLCEAEHDRVVRQVTAADRTARFRRLLGVAPKPAEDQLRPPEIRRIGGHPGEVVRIDGNRRARRRPLTRKIVAPKS